MLFNSGLMPRKAISPKPFESPTVPGVKSVISDQRPPFSGRFSIVAAVRTALRSGDSKLRMGVSPVTSTVAVDPAAFRWAMTSVVKPTCTMTLTSLNGAKPAALTVTV